MRIYRSCKVISAIVLGAALLATGCAAPASPTPSTPPPQSSRSSSTPSGQSKPPDQFSQTQTSTSSSTTSQPATGGPQSSTPNTSTPKATSWSSPPPMTIDQNKQYTATIKTNYGDMVVQLFPKEAPLTVNSFVFLSRQGFYNGVKFHRIVKNFVIQGGDPTGTGGGGPGYKFADEKVTRDYLKGSLAMANSGANTNGSQFFICLADLTGRLPKNYNLFGIVTGGMDVLDKIGNLPVAYNPNMGETSAPTVDVHINTIVIDEK